MTNQSEIQIWLIERLVFYARNPRKNDAAVDHMVASIREYVLARRDGFVVDGHLRLKAARKLGMTKVPECPNRGHESSLWAS
jgi:ParB-like chromosome segregation protein Spo0J